MIYELGKGKFINSSDIVAVFDLDITSQSHLTRKFLRASEERGDVENASEDIPKAFVLDRDRKITLVQSATATLAKHLEVKERKEELWQI